MANSEQLPTGYQLQNYRIEQVLGEGGFGLTYKATDLNLNRVVAIKEYIPLGVATRSNTGDVVPINADQEEAYEQGLMRFVEEAQALALFEHDNLVKVKSFLRQHNTAYIIMEYVDGMTFSEWLRQNPKPSEGALLGIILPILDGLHELHKTKLLHRDIKPSNIYICANDRPILLDFGAVRNSMRSDQNKQLSVIQYTEGYAPPEQYGKSGQGPWTDVYAVGACLYLGVTAEMVTNAMERFTEVQSGHPDPQPSINSAALREDYSEHFLDSIEHAISLNRKERISDALSLKNRLLNIEPLPVASVDDESSSTQGMAQAVYPTEARAPEDDVTVVRMQEEDPTIARVASANEQVAVHGQVAITEQPQRMTVAKKAGFFGSGKYRMALAAGAIAAVMALVLILKPAPESATDQHPSADTELVDNTAESNIPESIPGNVATDTDPTINQAQKTALLANVNSLYDQAEKLGIQGITKADLTKFTDDAMDIDLLKSNNNELQLIADGLVEALKVNARTYEIGSSAKDIEDALTLCKEYTSDCKREWYEDELLTTVSIIPFELDKSEITVGEFKRYAESQNVVTAAETNGFSYTVDPSKDFAVSRSQGINWKNAYGADNEANNFPAVHINRPEAEAYCQSVGKRLPTEAEWEYTARGIDRFIYPWGNTWDPDRVNWGGNNTASTLPVSSFQDNDRGYFDFAGSVTEWTSTDTDEENTAILKGGSRFDSNVANLRIPVKRLESMFYTGEDVGFRCARTVREWPVN